MMKPTSTVLRGAAASALMLLASASYAQLSGSVSVEGEYEPLVIDTDRLATPPAGFRFELPPANLDYEYSGIVTDFRPGLMTMGATGRQTAWPWQKRRGFIDFNIGSRLNSHLHAGATIYSDRVNTLTADLRFDMSTLFRMHGVSESFTRPPRKRLYDGKLGLDYTRIAGADGLLKASASYRAAYFNYYGTTIEKALLPFGAESIGIPTQTLNQATASVGYSSSTSTLRGWHAEGAVDFLAYRRLYSPVILGMESRGDTETSLNIGAGYAFPIGTASAVSIDAKGDFLFYPKRAPEALGIAGPSHRNYGVITVKPAFRMEKDNFGLNLGVDIIGAYDAMGAAPGEKFGAAHLAPDVSASFTTGKGFGMTLRATGGVTPATLQLRETFDRYQLPFLLANTPVYSPVDATLGFNVGPFAGFAAELDLRYAVARNIPVGGWYQALLDATSMNDLPATGYGAYNLHGASVNLGLRYDYGTLVGLKFDATYTPQNGKTGIFNGFDRPRWLLSAHAEARPINRLAIELGYDYRGVRNCYFASGEDVVGYRLPDVTDLNAKVTFSVLKNLDIYLKGENLLNRHVDLLPGLQSEGLILLGGVFIIF